MNEEEKEAIYEIEDIKFDERTNRKIEIILNLIDKLQKELQREKNRIMELAEMLDKKDEEIKFLETELEYYKDNIIEDLENRDRWE